MTGAENMKKSIVLDGRLLEYELERKSVKYLRLRVREGGAVFISAPGRTTQARIDAFLRENSGRIFRSVDRRREKTASLHLADPVRDGALRLYLGELLPLRIVKGSPGRCLIDSSDIYITAPDPSDEALCRRVLDGKLREDCAGLVRDISRRAYSHYSGILPEMPELKFRSMRSQWGNCRPKTNILTFNTRLINLPLSCVEYVVFHEFTHFLEQNHSPAFYAALSHHMPDWAERRRLLRKYEP